MINISIDSSYRILSYRSYIDSVEIRYESLMDLARYFNTKLKHKKNMVQWYGAMVWDNGMVQR